MCCWVSTDNTFLIFYICIINEAINWLIPLTTQSGSKMTGEQQWWVGTASFNGFEDRTGVSELSIRKIWRDLLKFYCKILLVKNLKYFSTWQPLNELWKFTIKLIKIIKFISSSLLNLRIIFLIIFANRNQLIPKLLITKNDHRAFNFNVSTKASFFPKLFPLKSLRSLKNISSFFWWRKILTHFWLRNRFPTSKKKTKLAI